MKTKFKIGTKVFFMENNEVKNEEIKGISTYTGEIKTLNIDKNVEEGKTDVSYHFKGYTSIDETDIFESLEDLKSSLFKDIESKSNS